MENLPLINQESENYAKEILAKHYANDMIPAEKKAYLTDLKNSIGPYMAIQAPNGMTHYMMDAASQIATLGLGFNAMPLMAPAHFQESYTNNPNSKNILKVHKGCQSFLKRKLNWERVYSRYTNSGAEANETALGLCYSSRVYPEAKKILAFEGSFHGRMLMSLQATWNPSKREPFAWEGHEAIFAPYPEYKGDEITHTIPQDWHQNWENPAITKSAFNKKLLQDPQIEKEIDSLLKVKSIIDSKEVFSIIIEPMQCEGGDRYSTNRFHTALLIMARTHNIPLIYDEVQTGFHLGREFFWHKAFNLQDQFGKPLLPDYVTCAKKAQVGMVLSPHRSTAIPLGEMEFQVASLIRGLSHGLALDQMQKQIHQLENETRQQLDQLITKYSDHIECPRLQGMAFAFDFKNKDFIPTFIAKRFEFGLLYYPAGSHTLRFRLNTAYKTEDLQFLFEQLDTLCNEIFNQVEGTRPQMAATKNKSAQSLYQWHEYLTELKLKSLQGNLPQMDQVIAHINGLLVTDEEIELVVIDGQNFSQFKGQIQEIQEQVYEVTRQTNIEKFEAVAKNQNGIALAFCQKGIIKAMTFAGPMSLTPLERGIRRDPDFNNPKALYMLDATVRPDFQGRSMGGKIKSALIAIAISKGIQKITGRNRDRLAGSMLAINQSLGATELFYMPEDYPDFEEHRDVLFYEIKTQWQEESINLSNGHHSHHRMEQMTAEQIKELMPIINNKVCLSNFVSEKFLTHVESIFNLLPESLRHGFTASGQSECVDKLAKTIWFKQKKSAKHLTFKGHHFGNGSFLSRSLGNTCDKEPGYFDVDQMETPTTENFQQVLKSVEDQLKKEQYLAIWIEPLPQNILKPVPKEFLKGLRGLATKYETPLLYNETASKAYHYHQDTFLAASDPEITPDGGFFWLGGQGALVFIEDHLFLEKPLMMISTWDGDELAMALYHQYCDRWHQNHEKMNRIIDTFEKDLRLKLTEFGISDIFLHRGKGQFTGNCPLHYQPYFKKEGQTYFVCPSLAQMQQFSKMITNG